MNALAAKVLPAPIPVAFDGLPAEGAPWAFAFDLWPLAQAQRWQVLLLRGAAGAYLAVATGTLDNVLTERLEALARAPVATQVVTDADFARLLQDGSKDFRAMDGVAQFQARGADEVVHELSALQLSEQASPVVRAAYLGTEH